jgi:hypothetical protein
MTLVIILLVLGYAALLVSVRLIRRECRRADATRLWRRCTWR